LVKTGGANKKRLRRLKEEIMTKADVKVSWLLTHQLALLTSSP